MSLAKLGIEAALQALLEKECASLDRSIPLTDQLNSLQLLHFALAVQREFSVKITDIEINERNFSSFESIVQLVARKSAVVHE